MRANRKDIRFNEFVDAVRLIFSNAPDRTSFGLCPDSTLRNQRSLYATTPRLLKDGADWASGDGSSVTSTGLELRNANDTETAPDA